MIQSLNDDHHPYSWLLLLHRITMKKVRKCDSPTCLREGATGLHCAAGGSKQCAYATMLAPNRYAARAEESVCFCDP